MSDIIEPFSFIHGTITPCADSNSRSKTIFSCWADILTRILVLILLEMSHIIWVNLRVLILLLKSEILNDSCGSFCRCSRKLLLSESQIVTALEELTLLLLRYLLLLLLHRDHLGLHVIWLRTSLPILRLLVHHLGLRTITRLYLLHRHHVWLLLLTHHLWILHVLQLLWNLIRVLHLNSHLRLSLSHLLLHHRLSWLLHHHWLLLSHFDLGATRNIWHRLLLLLRKSRRLLNLSILFFHLQINLLMFNR